MSALNVILDEINTRLLRVAGIAKVTRARLTPFKDGDLPAVNYWINSDLIGTSQHGADNHTVTLSIEAYDKTHDRPFVDVAMELHAGLVDSLNKEIGGAYSPNLGGIIQALSVTDFTPIIGEGQRPWCGALLTCQVKYQTPVNQTTLL